VEGLSEAGDGIEGGVQDAGPGDGRVQGKARTRVGLVGEDALVLVVGRTAAWVTSAGAAPGGTVAGVTIAGVAIAGIAAPRVTATGIAAAGVPAAGVLRERVLGK